MFLSKNKKNNVYPCKPQFYYTKVGFKGVKLYRHVFAMFEQYFFLFKYSLLSLSRLHSPRITAYLEMKIWSLFKHETLTTGNKIFWKRDFHLFFLSIFNMSLTSGVKLHIHLWNVVVRFIFFLNSANLVCRDTDTSKHLRESLGLRDNESRL